MPHRLLNETFDGEALHPLLKWMNPPSTWHIDGARSRLLLEPDAATDFWQETHYGFRLDTGHFLYAEVYGDAVVTASILCHPAHQYDQAGLMARFSSECWLKASAEFEPKGPSHLGAVVTNSGFSDWSLQDFPYGDTLSYYLRIRREGRDFLVEHAAGESGPWNLMRIARLLPGSEPCARIGLYACSPKGSGCRVEARFLRIELP
jgi:regulation of enolase protein 1 (concanavalin A-like superfamily)